MEWLVVNIGCIERGVSRFAIFGPFNSESEAKSVAARLDDTHSWREGGQNSFDVFPMPTVLNECAPGYEP